MGDLLQDPDRYAEAIGAVKGLNKAGLAQARLAIENALDTLYRAVGVDIDGTLTAVGDTALDVEIAHELRRLLRLGIPVILITGRGAESARDVVRELQAQRPDLSPARLHCIIRNGAAILEPATPGDRELTERFLVARELPESIWTAIGELTRAPDRLRPGSRTDEQVGAIRLEYSDVGLRNSAFSELKDRLGNVAFNVTIGQYESIHTINVTSTAKLEALHQLAQELGLEPQEVLRIGDQGSAGGNDADLLDSIAGFSVDTVGDRPDACHPVIDDRGDVVQGVPATLALLRGVVLSPPIKRVHTAITDAVLRRFGQVERFAREGAVVALQRATEDLAASMCALAGQNTSGLSGPPLVELADVFDPLSGAVRLRDFELDDLNLPADHPAARLFRLETVFDAPPASSLAMSSDSGVLLRGSLYYGGFKGLSVRDADRVPKYLRTSAAFADECVEVVRSLAQDGASFARLKLVFSIADHVRNALLQIVYVAWTTEAAAKEFVTLPPLVEGAIAHTDAFLRLLVTNQEPWRDALLRYADELALTVEVFDSVCSSPLGSLDETRTSSALIRDLREADHFIHNIAGVRMALEQHRVAIDLRRGEHLTCFGLPYGGIELPILAAVLGRHLRLDISPGYLPASTYQDEVRGDEVRGRDTKSVRRLTADFVRWSTSDRLDRVLLADDNTTTASTLQDAVDFLAVDSIETSGAIVIQYPTANRRAHMELEGHGCVDPDILLGFARGLVAPAAFTRLLRAGEGGNQYRDRLGVFNKSKNRIERLLQKNWILALEDEGGIE